MASQCPGHCQEAVLAVCVSFRCCACSWTCPDPCCCSALLSLCCAAASALWCDLCGTGMSPGVTCNNSRLRPLLAAALTQICGQAWEGLGQATSTPQPGQAMVEVSSNRRCCSGERALTRGFYLLPPQQFAKALKINFPHASGSVSKAKLSLESVSGSRVPVPGSRAGCPFGGHRAAHGGASALWEQPDELG